MGIFDEFKRLAHPYEDEDEDDDDQDGGSLPPIPKKDRTGLISRGSAPAPRRTADAPSASKLPEVDPSSRLSGFKFGRRPLEPPLTSLLRAPTYPKMRTSSLRSRARDKDKNRTLTGHRQ